MTGADLGVRVSVAVVHPVCDYTYIPNPGGLEEPDFYHTTGSLMAHTLTLIMLHTVVLFSYTSNLQRLKY